MDNRALARGDLQAAEETGGPTLNQTDGSIAYQAVGRDAMRRANPDCGPGQQVRGSGRVFPDISAAPPALDLWFTERGGLPRLQHGPAAKDAGFARRQFLRLREQPIQSGGNNTFDRQCPAD